MRLKGFLQSQKSLLSEMRSQREFEELIISLGKHLANIGRDLIALGEELNKIGKVEEAKKVEKPEVTKGREEREEIRISAKWTLLIGVMFLEKGQASSRTIKNRIDQLAQEIRFPSFDAPEAIRNLSKKGLVQGIGDRKGKSYEIINWQNSFSYLKKEPELYQVIQKKVQGREELQGLILQKLVFEQLQRTGGEFHIKNDFCDEVKNMCGNLVGWLIDNKLSQALIKLHHEGYIKLIEGTEPFFYYQDKPISRIIRLKEGSNGIRRLWS